MSADVLSEMGMIVREAGEPAAPGESVKAAINRAARNLALGYRRTKAYWYGEVRMVPAQEADALRVKRRELLIRKQAQLDAELAAVKARIAALKASA